VSEYSRKCIECGKMHDTGLQDMKTGEMIERFDKCYDCFMKNAYSFKEITEQVVLDDVS